MTVVFLSENVTTIILVNDTVGDDEDVRCVKVLINLSCGKRSVRLTKGAK
jgi:hypothetical protein